MTKSAFEKRILQRAEEKLNKEYETFCITLRQSPFTKNIKIGDQYLVGAGQSSLYIFPEYAQQVTKDTQLELLINGRREELVKIETDEVLKRLESVAYLFAQQ